jgi:light-harvesting complex I chlorophyll a/b binding protein 1
MMKLALLASLIGSASAFAPASTGARAVTSLNEKSQAIPFLPKPENTSGYIGDAGFDPLRFSDYFPMDYLAEAEIKHGRIAMLAWAGWVTVDLGIKVYPAAPGMSGLTAVNAHDVAVANGSMGQIFLGIAACEMIGWIAVSQMLQGSGRAPGDFQFGASFLSGKSPEQIKKLKLNEVKNGRLAMLAISGVATQAVLYGQGFPYF